MSEDQVYVRWVNNTLKNEKQITSIYDDLVFGGIVFHDFIEKISGKKIGKLCTEPRLLVQRVDNLTRIFEFLQKHKIKSSSRISIVNLAQGKEGVGSILDLFWEISAKFFIKKLFKQIRFETTIKLKSEKEKILQWVRTQVGDTITIKNISSLQDARILCHLIHKYQPSSMDNNYLGRSATENYEKSLEILYNHWNIVYLLPLDEFVNSTLPERSLLLFYTFMIQKIQEDFSFLTPNTAAIVTFINKEIEGIIHDDSPLPASSPRKTPRNKDKKTPRSKDSSKDASKIHEEPATPLSPRSASRKKDAASMDASKVYEEPGTPLSPRSASRKKDAASKDASKIHEESGTPLSPRSGSRKRGATSSDASKMHEESATPLSPRSGSRKKDATSKDSSKDQAKENNKESSKESVKITVKDSPSRENLLETEKRRKRNHSENSTSSRSEKKRPKSRKIASGMVTGSQEDPLGPSGLGYSNSTSSSAPGGLPKSKTRKKSRNSVARKEEKSKLIEELSEINKQIQMKAEKYEEESKLFSLKLQSAKSKKKMLSEENRRLLDENERLKEEVKKFKEEVNTLNREKLTSLLKKPPSKPLLRKTSGLSESSESSDFEKSKKVLRTSGKIPFLQNRSNSSSKHIFSPPASVNRVLSDENISLVEPDSENSTSEIFPSPRPLLRTSFAFPSPPVNHPPPPPPPPPSSSSTSTSPKQNGAGTDSETSGPLSQRERKALLKVKLGDGTFISVIIKPTTSANELKSEIIKKLVKRLAGDNREDAEKSFKSTHQLMEEVLISDQQILFDSLDHYTSESKVLLFKDPKASQNNFYASLTNQSSNDSSSEPKISIESAHFNRSTDQVVSILANKIQILSQENEGLRSKNLQLKMKKKGKNDKLLMIDTSKLEVNEKIADTGGSFAKVYNVSVDGWGCAMKELEIEEFRNQFSDQPEGSGFIREVELLQNLPTHPNIVKYLFCDRNSPSRTRLFMQKYAGTLRNFLNMKRQRNNGFFEPEDIQRYLLDICAGINYLHQHTIIHRDLKSDNIFVTLTPSRTINRLAIGDFDTSKELRGSTVAKTIIGTPSFIAPEVLNARTNGGYTFKADVYSFGMIVYELLTLKEPYEGCKIIEVSEMILSGKIPQLPEDLSSIYDPIKNLYHTTTKMDPDERPCMEAILEQVKSMPFIVNPNARLFL